MPCPRVAGLALLALATAACPNPRNPLGPPGGPEPPAGSRFIAFPLGGGGADQVTAVAIDPTGSMVVAGEFMATVDFDPSASGSQMLTSFGGTDLFLARYSTPGDLQWVVRAGGSSDARVSAVAVDPTGNIVIGGSFAAVIDFGTAAAGVALTSQGARDGFVASYTSAGTLRWARRLGGILDDEVLSVAIRPDGTVFASGTFRGTAATDPPAEMAITSAGGVDGFLASWEADGTPRWAFSVGGTADDSAAALALAPGGGVFLAGSFAGTADFGPDTVTAALTSLGGSDAFLARYSGEGQLVWLRGLHGAGNVSIGTGGLAATATGALAATGTFAGTADFGGSDGVASRTSQGVTDAFVVRYEPAGGFGWVVAPGGTTAVRGRAVVMTASGEVIITGSFTGTARFDPGAGATALTALGSAGATDIYLARYGTTGSFQWALGIGAPLAGEAFASAGLALAADGAGHALLGGRFFGSVDVNPDSELTVLISRGGADGFMARYTPGGALAPRP